MSTNVTITRRKIQTLTERMTDGSTVLDRRDAIETGWNAQRNSRTRTAMIRNAQASWIRVRVRHGFAPIASDILTPPSANAKLIKGTAPAYGLTCQSHVTTLSTGAKVNACPNAGHCVRVCVLQNGNGRYASVQRARDARSEFLAEYPFHALILIGWELARATAKHGGIAFRPNVNSDIDWYAVVGDLLTDLPGVISYGYSKMPRTMTHPSGLTHVAYSWGETSDVDDVAAYLREGGNVARVTDRKPGAPIRQWSDVARVVDADKSDEWMFARGVIGDLSAKGKARDLIGKSGFVGEYYG